ncbi:PLP-dependent aminotransferase family protein [Streptomyces sp. NPDC048636]|uniref:MocR-like pyridoxine biosynthesis transcription factor PdxR n=1 Tax=Streptomyces sp. NPDC048636 TaxID=3155762 RepID=UPI00344A146E
MRRAKEGSVNRSKESSEDTSKEPGADFLQLDIGEAPARGRAQWLAERLRLALADGRLPVGSTLPATRRLAADLGVSRGVVTDAYQRLAEAGHVTGRGRGGTTVVSAPTLPRPERPPATAPSSSALFGQAPPGTDIFDRLRTTPARIDLSPGLPDLAAFPRAAWLRAERAVLNTLEPSAFGYSDPSGAPAVRRSIARWLALNRGIRVDAEEVIIVAGVSQALALIAHVLRRDGITGIAVEDPCSLGIRQHLNYWGMDTPPVRVDADGLRVDELTASGAKAVVLTPAHQFPTGVVLHGDRRRHLSRWAEDGGLIIEDDYDAEHRYDRPPVSALRAALPEHVFYTGSISKLLAPALRLGWLLAPARYRDALALAKRNSDLGNAVLPQLVLAELLDSGELERQLRLLRRRHVHRRDAMIKAIAGQLPGTEVHGAAAGLHLTITFAPGVDGVALAAAAFALGVKAHPLSWYGQRPQPPGIVLGYAASPPGDIAEGIAALGAALRHQVGGNPR